MSQIHRVAQAVTEVGKIFIREVRTKYVRAMMAYIVVIAVVLVSLAVLMGVALAYHLIGAPLVLSVILPAGILIAAGFFYTMMRLSAVLVHYVVESSNTFAHAFQKASHAQTMNLISMFVLTLLVTFALLPLLFIPALYFAMASMFAIYSVIIEGRTARSAIKHSVELFHRAPFVIILSLVIIELLMTVVLIVTNSNPLVQFLLSPIGIIAGITLYDYARSLPERSTRAPDIIKTAVAAGALLWGLVVGLGIGLLYLSA